jgi:hypothetical protein
MTAEAKMRTLAQQDETLQSFFFTGGQVRWFDRQLQPKYIEDGSCVRVTRVSSIPLYSHETRTQRSQNRIEPVRFQIDVLDLDAERARAAATAVIDWLATVDFSSDSQFASPVTSPTRHPNVLLNHRSGMEPKTKAPVWVEILDVRILNLEE